MPVQPNVRICTHIKITGVRCGSPALRGEQFCYFHQRMVRGVRTPPQARLHPIALIESEEAIQASLMEVINALARNTIDIKRAELILRALHIAVKNARRVHFDRVADSMVKEVPEYPTPPRVAASGTSTTDVISTNHSTNHGRTGAHAHLSRAEGIEGELKNADQLPTTGKGATSSRTDQTATQNAASAAEGPRVPLTNCAVDPTLPKPPVSDKSAEILHSRKKRAPSG